LARSASGHTQPKGQPVFRPAGAGVLHPVRAISDGPSHPRAPDFRLAHVHFCFRCFQPRGETFFRSFQLVALGSYSRARYPLHARAPAQFWLCFVRLGGPYVARGHACWSQPLSTLFAAAPNSMRSVGPNTIPSRSTGKWGGAEMGSAARIRP